MTQPAQSRNRPTREFDEEIRERRDRLTRAQLDRDLQPLTTPIETACCWRFTRRSASS